MKISILSAIIIILFSNSVFADSLNIYSHRQPYLLKPFLDAYTKKTGVKLNVVYSSKGLAQRLAAEGENSPADLILTVDIARLYRYEDLDLLAKINSNILTKKYQVILEVRGILGLVYQKELGQLLFLKKE